jgi:hypothetical protein
MEFVFMMHFGVHPLLEYHTVVSNTILEKLPCNELNLIISNVVEEVALNPE